MSDKTLSRIEQSTETKSKDDHPRQSLLSRRGVLSLLGASSLAFLSSQSASANKGKKRINGSVDANINPDVLITRRENNNIYAYKQNGIVKSGAEFVPVLNAAIEFALDRGGYIYLDSGDYKISSEINSIGTANRNAEIFKLQGTGRSTRIHSDAPIRPFVVNNGKCWFSNFRLEFTGSKIDGADGIRLTDARWPSSNMSVTEGRFTNLWLDGYFNNIYSAGNNTFMHNVIAKNGLDNNISISGQSDHVYMNNLLIEGARESGIELDTAASQANLTNIHTRNNGEVSRHLESGGIQIDTQQGANEDLAAARDINISNVITEEDTFGILILGGDSINISNHISHPFSEEGGKLNALRIDNKGGFSPQSVNVSSFVYGVQNGYYDYDDAITIDADTNRLHFENGVIYANRGVNLDNESAPSSDDGSDIGLYQIRFNCANRAINREFGGKKSGSSPKIQASDLFLDGSADLGILLRGENLQVQMNNIISSADNNTTLRFDCPQVQISNILAKNSNIEIHQGQNHHLSNIATQSIDIRSGVNDTRIDNHTIGQINDSGKRTIVDNFSENVGNPNEEGAWNGSEREGIFIEDTQNPGDVYLWLPNANVWTPISS